MDSGEIGSLVHIIGLIGGPLGPLIMYFASNDESVKENAARASNWQISAFLYSIFATALLGFTWFALVLFVVNFCFSAIAARKALDGVFWDYPLTMSFLSVDADKSESIDRIEHSSQIERIKDLYTSGVIDETEMEERIEKHLQYSEERQRSRELDYSLNR